MVADTTYAAMQGRDALEIQWDNGPNASESSETLRRQFDELIAKPGKTIVNTGDVDGALGGGAKKDEAIYEVPFLAHATMEPMNCTVDIPADRAEVWAPTQGPVWIRDTVAHIAGLKPEAVTVHTTLMGGGFGRRYQADFAAEAAQIRKPPARPSSCFGRAKTICSTISIAPRPCRNFQARWIPPGKSRRGITGSLPLPFARSGFRRIRRSRRIEIGEASAIPYLVENFRLEYANPKSSVPVAWWRSVENSMNGFTIESFIDELAAAAGIDPLEFRIRAIGPARQVKNGTDPETPPLDTARIKAALQLAADKAGWGSLSRKAAGAASRVISRSTPTPRRWPKSRSIRKEGCASIAWYARWIVAAP